MLKFEIDMVLMRLLSPNLKLLFRGQLLITFQNIYYFH